MSKRKKFSLPQERHPRPGRDRPVASRTRPASRRVQSAGSQPASGGAYWIYGRHAVRAALANPRRRIQRLLVVDPATPASREIAALAESRSGDPSGGPLRPETIDPAGLAELLPEGAVHQGVAARTFPLPSAHLEDLCKAAAASDRCAVLVLDQVTDPHNVGAILRSAVAFGAGALITTARHSPAESGVLAKSASGALEHIDHIEVRNLAEAIGELHEAGFQTIGLDSEGPLVLEETFSGRKIALVLGAEGRGLRQKTRETVTALARLDMPGAIRSLNVSNAAAVGLYAARKFLNG